MFVSSCVYLCVCFFSYFFSHLLNADSSLNVQKPLYVCISKRDWCCRHTYSNPPSPPPPPAAMVSYRSRGYNSCDNSVGGVFRSLFLFWVVHVFWGAFVCLFLFCFEMRYNSTLTVASPIPPMDAGRLFVSLKSRFAYISIIE